MCGICGGFGPTLDLPLDRMGSCQCHRGPESTGTHTDDLAKLSNQRLRVIDVEGGDQPIYNEDGDVVVVYNGEIYNFGPLREELRVAGHTFTTDTDTEVLVHGYEEYGTALFERLNGMFAAAIYDATEQRLLLGRDRAGIKPLYVAAVDGGIVFGSEPKTLLQSGLVEPAVDTDALRYFLQLRYSPSQTTLFDGIEPVEPGTYLDIRYENGEVTRTTTTFRWRRSARRFGRPSTGSWSATCRSGSTSRGGWIPAASSRWPANSATSRSIPSVWGSTTTRGTSVPTPARSQTISIRSTTSSRLRTSSCAISPR
jgi:asparagine synthase (glutamine-hydrolysing)